LLTLLVLTALGCGGATTGSTDSPTAPPPDTTPGGEHVTGTVSVPLVGDVAAVRIIDRRPADAPRGSAFNAPAKIQRAVDILKLTGSLAESTAPVTNCAPSVIVDFLDAHAKVAGSVQVVCGSSDRTPIATLVVADKRYGVPLSDLESLVNIVPDANLLANYLFDIASVAIDQPQNGAHVAYTTTAEIDRVIASLSPVDSLDPTAPRTRCIDDYVVTFSRPTAEGDGPIVSRLFLSCGSAVKESQPAWFQTADALGGQVTVNGLTIATFGSQATTAGK
jgi:hypothetical protein